MKEPIILHPGDPCPACGGAFEQAPQPTAEQRKAAENTKDSERWIPLPPHYDTAPLADVLEHGELWRCVRCGCPQRWKPQPAAPATAAAK